MAPEEPHRNSREQRAVVSYFYLVTAEICRVNSDRVLHIAVPGKGRRLDVNPNRSADMRRLF